MSAMSEERRKAWHTLIESTDMTHNSKKAWSTLRKLCDDPCKPKQHYNTTANQVAHQLLLNGRVPNRQPKVCLDRQRYPDDPGFTRAFTAAELDIGIRVLKNGKAPGLDDIQTELIKQFGPKTHDWLLRFFNNYTKTKKIPKIWRQAKVVALLKPGKDPSVAKSFRPISLLCHTYKLYLFIYLLCHIYPGVPHQCATLFSLRLLHYMHDKTNINQHTFSYNTVTTLTTWYKNKNKNKNFIDPKRNTFKYQDWCFHLTTKTNKNIIPNIHTHTYKYNLWLLLKEIHHLK